MNNQLFVIKERKENIKREYQIPRHEEYVFVESLHSNSWRARNEKTGEEVVVTRKEHGVFYEYEINS